MPTRTPQAPAVLRAGFLLVSLVFWFLPPAPAGAEQAAEGGDVAAGKKLLAEGDKLADDGKYEEAALRYKEAFEKLLPGMRKLPFKRGVAGMVTPRDQLRDILLKKVDEDMPPEKIRADELGMKALGLLPSEMDLKQTMVKMLTEEVAGFYDPKDQTMHLIRETPPKEPEKKPGLLDRVFGAGRPKGFDKDETKGILAHEMTHALADQHFGLETLGKAAEGDGDRSLALMSLVEGEAMVTMIGAVGEDWAGETVTKLPAGRLNMMMNLMGPLMGRAAGPTFREAPPILSETLIFPYLKGLVFCARLTNKGGWPAIDNAYHHPPLSTEQVLHPEKYLGEGPDGKPDVPTAIDLGALRPGDEWKEVTRDTLGELAMSVMLRQYNGRAAAAGWDGDTYAAFEGTGGRLGLVWLTTWDTEDDAREFARNYARYQAARFGGKDGANKKDGADDRDGQDKPGDRAADTGSVRKEFDGRAVVVEVRGPDVAVIEGFAPAVTDTLLDAALNAKKTEKTDASRPAASTGETAPKRQGGQE